MGWFNFTTITPSAEYDSNQTLASSTRYAMIDCSNTSVTITLGAASSNKRTIHTIKKIDSSGNSVTIDANGSEKIDGELTVELKLQYSYITIICDGTEWFIIGGEYVKMEDLLKRLLNEVIENTYKTLIEVKQSKLHLAKLSGEKITEKDIKY